MSRTSPPGEETLVRYQETPNPKALKFIVNKPLKAEGKATFKPDSEFYGLKLIESMFEVEGARQVYIQGHTLTFTHSGVLGNDEIKKRVESIIKTRWPVHDPTFQVGEKSHRAVNQTKGSEEICEIEEILNRTIRPGLQADGGDIEVISYENNEVRIIYQGACGGCPSAMMGTLDAIQSILGQELGNPELRVYPL